MQTEKNTNKDRERVRDELYSRFSKRGQWRLRVKRFIGGLTWILVVQCLSGAKRTLDFSVALLLLLGLSPLFLAATLLSRGRFERSPRVGRWCATFDRLSLAARSGFGGSLVRFMHMRGWPVLINIVRGDMSFIGPRAVVPGDLGPREREVRRRYQVRPGLLSLWWIKKRGNVDYATEFEVDADYVESQSIWGDVGIALRSIPAVLYGNGVATAPDEITILGIPVDNLTMSDTIEEIMTCLESTSSRQVCFLNADCANIAYRDENYMNVLKNSDICLADGIGLKIAGKLLKKEIKQNVNGTDLFPFLCEALSGSGKKIFLLGARPGIVAGVADWIGENHPDVIVAGCHDGYFSPEEEPAVINQIKKSDADLLLVAFGAPRQDTWISEHIHETGVKVGIGVGGLFDFFSGRIERAPLWMREIGMEWLYRFIQEPGRLWKRYFIGNGVFLYRVMVEKITGKIGSS